MPRYCVALAETTVTLFGAPARAILFTCELARAAINAPRETTAKVPAAMPSGTRRDLRIGICGFSSSVVMVVSSLLFTEQSGEQRPSAQHVVASDRQLNFRFC